MLRLNQLRVSTPKSVVIVDDEEPVRLSLGWIVEQCEGFTCVAKYAAAEEALRLIPAVSPDLVLMDIRMPGMSGIECTRRLRVINPSLRVVMVTGLSDEESMTEAFEAGACEYLIKPFSMLQCVATLRAAFISQPVSSTSCAAALQLARLKEREKSVMRHLIEGLLYKQIADVLGISISLVGKNAGSVYRKLKVRGRGGLIEFYYRNQRDQDNRKQF